MFPVTSRILIADDMASVRRVLIKDLNKAGFSNIDQAEDGEEAWQMINKSFKTEKPFDIVISDWNMPKIRGMDLLFKVRENENMNKLVFVFLTAENEQHKVRKALKEGASAFVLKPVSSEVLLQKLAFLYEALLA